MPRQFGAGNRNFHRAVLGVWPIPRYNRYIQHVCSTTLSRQPDKEPGVQDKATQLFTLSSSTVVPSPLFADLDSATVAMILAQLSEETVPTGHVIFEEHAPGDTLYIVTAGQIRISRLLPHGEERVLRDMGPGEFFGEMALLEDKPRTARVSTLT